MFVTLSIIPPFLCVTKTLQNCQKNSKETLNKEHYAKSVRIRSYSAPHFPEFGLNTERQFVSFRIQSECGKMQTRITPNTDTFCALQSIGLKTIWNIDNTEDNLELYTDIYHLLISRHKFEHQQIQIGKDIVWKENKVTLLGLTIDNELIFDSHISNMCSEANKKKLSVLCRLKNDLTFQQQRVLFKSFFEVVLPISWHWSLSIPPEHRRKPLVLRYFQGVQKETSGMKWVK